MSIGVNAEVLAAALPSLKSGDFDPLLGHEYAYPGSRLSDFIDEQHRLIQSLRIEKAELMIQVRTLTNK